MGVLLGFLLCNFFAQVPLPWENKTLAPAEPYKEYTPAIVPNGTKLPYQVVDGVKVFHLIAEPLEWEVAPGLKIHAWGYNGSVPGPLIEVAAGDRVKIYVTNKLPAPTTVHWHGVVLPCGMDGVTGLTQPPILAGETFVYSFTFAEPGTFMYHSHLDIMNQEAMGLNGMIVVHHREMDPAKRPDRDFVIFLHEWRVDVGASRPNPFEMIDFNVLTMNGKVMPATAPLLAELGDRVFIRFGNLSTTDHHPIHLHGYKFKVIGSDGGWVADSSAILPETTVLVPVGSTRVVEFLADNPGDWMMHCHMTHHTMNQMGHNLPNMLGMRSEGLDEKMQKLVPGYMTMGTETMFRMHEMSMPVPDNSIPMLDLKGQFGSTDMGGMSTILKVREKIDGDPAPYQFPEGTLARKAKREELDQDRVSEALTMRDYGLQVGAINPERHAIKTLNKMGCTYCFCTDLTKSFLDFCHTRPPKHVLEIGCCFGLKTALIAHSPASVVALDLDKGHVAAAQKQFQSLAESHPKFGDVLFVQGSFLDKDLESVGGQPFDAVMIESVLHFLSPEEVRQGLQRLHSFLKPGGKLYITVSSPYLKYLAEAYEENKAHGSEWPGFFPDPEKVHPVCGFLRKPYHTFDQATLERELKAQGFSIMTSLYMDKPHHETDLALDGREGLMIIAEKQ